MLTALMHGSADLKIVSYIAQRGCGSAVYARRTFGRSEWPNTSQTGNILPNKPQSKQTPKILHLVEELNRTLDEGRKTKDLFLSMGIPLA